MSRLHNPSSLSTLILAFALLATACDENEFFESANAETDAPLEVCSTIGEARECGAGEGTQFCSGIEGAVAWGDCLVDFACMPSDSDECVLVDGVPQLQGDVYGVSSDEGTFKPPDPELAMSKVCYGGSGWWCCDVWACWYDYMCPGGLCCDSWTQCVADEG